MERLNDFWRVCRVVSLERRLKLLWLLFDTDELSVKQLTLGAETTQPNASIQLQTLRAAGLVRFRRKSMNVIYHAEADERVDCATSLLKALRCCFERSVPFAVVTHCVTAFTHERRIEIVRLLDERSRSYNQLLDGSRMNSSALSRHLHKLEVRGFVEQREGFYSLKKPEALLGRALLKIAVSSG